MTALMFGGDFFHFDLQNPGNPRNDRLIFSKGHASPLFYSLWAAAGEVTEEELFTLRQFGSRLEGHPTMAFPYTEVATGSLGQGLSVGVGVALNAKYLDKLSYRTYALLGDSEMSEGSVWEACALAAYYRLDNLVAIVDVNRLGQRGETMHGYDLIAYKKKMVAFGWNTIIVPDGHSISACVDAYAKAKAMKGRPTAIIARTIKGKGLSFLENKEGWHGRPLSQEELEKALKELGEIDKNVRGKMAMPLKSQVKSLKSKVEGNIFQFFFYKKDQKVSTRKAYGIALARVGKTIPDIVALDAEVSNSTYAEIFQKEHPKRFFEMFIAEQNMVGAALGLSRRGKIPFVSTFAAFFTRAFDQIRMSQYSNANIKFVGSHAGVSIGEDGPSQMGLEDIALFRAVHGSVVLYPSDAVAMERLVEEAISYHGIVYLRTTRMDTPILYKTDERFPIGGSKTLKKSKDDVVTVIGAGITVHEALKAYTELKKEGIIIRVIDMYSVKPLDTKIITQACKDTQTLIVVEDHYPEGGLYEAICGSGVVVRPTYSLAVRKMPKSGKLEELLDYEEISAGAIVKKVKKIAL